MPSYIIGKMQIHSREWMSEYFEKAPPLIEKFGGRFVVRGGDPKTLEGSEKLPDAMFILEFADREAVLKFWNSPEFEPLIKLRQTGSSLEAVLVDSL